MRKHDHGQIPSTNYNKIKLKTRSLFKNGCSIKLNGQDGKSDISSSRKDLNLDLDNSNLNDDEDELRCSSKELARSVEDDDEIEDYDDEDDEDEEDDDLEDEDDEDFDEDESEDLAKSVENKKILVQST